MMSFAKIGHIEKHVVYHDRKTDVYNCLEESTLLLKSNTNYK